jgi:hypothetical protein
MSQIIRKLSLKSRPKRTALLEDWAYPPVLLAWLYIRI